MATHTPGRVLVPISNWAAFGGSKEVIVWLPIDMIATTITALVALRKQVIEDIYQIMGLSDIMRGSTDPQETLGAQRLKTQYGSTRIRDKQQELVRLAKDLVEITLEIVTEKFDEVTIIEMSQTQLPTKQMIDEQSADRAAACRPSSRRSRCRKTRSAAGDAAEAGSSSADDAAFQQMQQKAQESIQKLQQKPTSIRCWISRTTGRGRSRSISRPTVPSWSMSRWRSSSAPVRAGAGDADAAAVVMIQQEPKTELPARSPVRHRAVRGRSGRRDR